MLTRRAPEVGETLIEILISVVLAGIIASASFFMISTGATSSKSQRDFVTADVLLRDSAEATKTAVRNSCANGGTYSIAYSALPAPDPTQTWAQYYTIDRSFTLPADVANKACPTVTGPLSPQFPTIVLLVTLPSGTQKSLSIIVRAP